MNEKRFKCVSDYDWWGVIDITGEIKGEYGNEHFSTDTVVDLLNSFDGTIKDLSDDYQRLMGENEELKRKYFELKRKYFELKRKYFELKR